MKRILTIVFLISFLYSNGQEVKQYFFNIDLDTCFGEILNNFDNEKDLKSINRRYHYKTYTLFDINNDSLKSDSIEYSIDTLVWGGYINEYCSHIINCTRYYSSIEEANLYYNRVLNNLIDIDCKKRHPYEAYTSSATGNISILDGPYDIIAATGFQIIFDEKGEHRLSITIDFKYENVYVLIIEYWNLKKDC